MCGASSGRLVFYICGYTWRHSSCGKLKRHRMHVLLNDELVALLELSDPQVRKYEAKLAADLLRDRYVLKLETPGVQSPQKLGASDPPPRASNLEWFEFIPQPTGAPKPE